MTKGTILIANDKPLIEKYLTISLRDRGYQTTGLRFREIGIDEKHREIDYVASVIFIPPLVPENIDWMERVTNKLREARPKSKIIGLSLYSRNEQTYQRELDTFPNWEAIVPDGTLEERAEEIDRAIHGK